MRIDAGFLKDTVVELLVSLGTDPAEAAVAADGLVAADLRGVRTHGVNYLPLLADRIQNGLVNVPTTLSVLSEGGAVLHLDGGNGIGQVAGTRAMQAAIDNARRVGLGMSLVRNTNNIGMLAFYSCMAADAGMIGLCMTNGAASMAPWGAAEAALGSNPLSIAAPAAHGGPPIVLDMATTLVSRGKVRRAVRQGQPIPADWALDAHGRPTEDPIEALRGTLLPIGGPKGSGLAFFIDVICGLLSGSQFGQAIKSFHEPEGPTGVGAMTMAIDVTRFMPLEQFTTLLSQYGQSLRALPPAPGVTRIRLPGDIEAERQQDSLRRGIEVDGPVCEAIDRLLEQAGFARRLDAGAIAVQRA